MEKVYQVELLDGNRSFPCKETQNLLAAMERAGIHDIKGCRNGGCGVCKISILEGEVELGVMSRAHVTKEEQAHGIVLACRAWPRSDMKVSIFRQD